MKQVNVHEAKSTLSHLLKLAESGEEVVIARAGSPVVYLTLVKSKKRKPKKEKIKFGGWKGQVKISEDFDKCDEELWKDWLAEDILNP